MASSYNMRKTELGCVAMNQSTGVSKMTVKRIKQELASRGLPTTGLKAALVERLTQDSAHTPAATPGVKRPAQGKKKAGPSELAPTVGFERLPDDTQSRIMGHVLSSTTFIGTGWGTRTRPQISVAGAAALTCKSWHHTVEFAVNSNTKSSIAPLELARIKRTAMALDLSSIHDQFYKACEKRFQDSFDANTEEDPGLDMISLGYIEDPSDFFPLMLEHFEIESDTKTPKEMFCHYVELEYKRFMVLKAIEAREPPDAGNQWNTRCQPTCLIDEFWHAHMLQPCKYQTFCVAVLGELIDHEPGYVAVCSENAFASTTVAKLRSTFRHDGYAGLITALLLARVSGFDVEHWKLNVLTTLRADEEAMYYDDCG